MMTKRTLNNDDFYVEILFDDETDSTTVTVYPLIPFKERLVAPELNLYRNYGAHVITEKGVHIDDIYDVYYQKLHRHRPNSKIGVMAGYDDHVLHYVWNGKVIYTVYVAEDHYDIITSGMNKENVSFRLEIEEVHYYSKLYYNGVMYDFDFDGRHINKMPVDIICP